MGNTPSDSSSSSKTGVEKDCSQQYANTSPSSRSPSPRVGKSKLIEGALLVSHGGSSNSSPSSSSSSNSSSSSPKRSSSGSMSKSGEEKAVYAITTAEEVPPRILASAKDGPGDVAPITLYQSFEAAVANWGDRPSLGVKRPGPGQALKDTPFSFYTWREYFAVSQRFGRALMALGFQPHGVINILGFNA
ncbi:hypothetical protein VYU27_010028, partial [Nannochloropsis oceanica]